MPTIRSIVSKIQELVDKFNSLDDRTKTVIAKIAAFAAALGPALVVTGKLTSGIGTVLSILPKVAAAMGGLPVLAVTAAIAGLEMITALTNSLIEQLPLIIDAALQLIVTLVQGLMDNLPQIIQAALNLILALVQGIIDNLPMIIKTAINLIITIVETIVENLPMIIDAAIQIIIALVEGLVSAIPQILSAVWNLVTSVIDKFLSGDWIGTGINILTSLIDGLVSMVSSVLSAIGDLIGQIFDKFLDLGSDMLDVGKNIVEGLWDGISGAAGCGIRYPDSVLIYGTVYVISSRLHHRQSCLNVNWVLILFMVLQKVLTAK